MQRFDAERRQMQRTLWELAQAHDDDRHWIVNQLSDDERAALADAIHGLEDNLSSAASFSVALQQSLFDRQPTDSDASAISLAALPDWLAVRVLLRLAPAERRACFGTIPIGRRWRLRRTLIAHRGDPRLTPTTGEALLDCVRGSQVRQQTAQDLS